MLNSNICHDSLTYTIWYRTLLWVPECIECILFLAEFVLTKHIIYNHTHTHLQCRLDFFELKTDLETNLSFPLAHKKSFLMRFVRNIVPIYFFRKKKSQNCSIHKWTNDRQSRRISVLNSCWKSSSFSQNHFDGKSQCMEEKWWVKEILCGWSKADNMRSTKKRNKEKTIIHIGTQNTKCESAKVLLLLSLFRLVSFCSSFLLPHIDSYYYHHEFLMPKSVHPKTFEAIWLVMFSITEQRKKIDWLIYYYGCAMDVVLYWDEMAKSPTYFNIDTWLKFCSQSHESHELGRIKCVEKKKPQQLKCFRVLRPTTWKLCIFVSTVSLPFCSFIRSLYIASYRYVYPCVLFSSNAFVRWLRFSNICH